MVSKNLKITILDFDDIKNTLLGAGGARATYALGSRFASKGHCVEVICSKYSGFRDRVEKGISYKHIGLSSGNNRLNNIIFILTLPFAVRRIRADVIIECFTSPISTLFSPLFTKIPVVAVPTSFEAERFAEKYHLPFQYIENFGLRFYKYFIAPSKYFEDKILEVNSHVVTKICPLGVDKNHLSIKPKTPKYILYLGRFDIGQKGLDLLIAAYAKVCNELKIQLLLVGFGPDRARIIKIINDLGMQKHIKLVGPKYKKEKLELLSKALFFVAPSRHEGFCLAALEALAVGVPVVSFDIPGLSWVSNEVSLKAKAFDDNDYAIKMIRASNPAINNKLRRKCKRFARNFSWEKVANEYLAFFNTVLDMHEKK